MVYQHAERHASESLHVVYDFTKDFDEIVRPGLGRFLDVLAALHGDAFDVERRAECVQTYRNSLWRALSGERADAEIREDEWDAERAAAIAAEFEADAIHAEMGGDDAERPPCEPVHPDDPVMAAAAEITQAQVSDDAWTAHSESALRAAGQRLQDMRDRGLEDNAELVSKWMLNQVRADRRQAESEAWRQERAKQKQERAEQQPKQDAPGSGDPLAGIRFDEGGIAAPEPMLIRRLLPRSGIGMLGGQSGVGKSFVMCYGATELAVGGNVFGYPVYERVGSVILAAEGSATMQNRITVSRQKATDLAKLPIAWIGNVPNLSNKAEVRKLTARLERVKDRFLQEFGMRLGVIWIDTLAAAARFKDENDNSEVERVADNLRLLADLSKSFVMGTHHYGKDAEVGLRGASANRAVCDVVWSAIGSRDQQTGKIVGRKFALAKSRSDEEGLISGFELKFEKLGLDAHDHDFGSCYVEPDKPGKPDDRDTPWSEATRLKTRLLEAYHVLACDVEDSIVFGRAGRPVRKVHKNAIRDWLKSRGYLGDSDPQVPLEEKDRHRFDRAREAIVGKKELIEKDGYLWLPK